jgi:predicted esterase
MCHGTPPWDTPPRQIRDWTKLAEEKKFIVAAPTLKGTRGDFPPPPARQIELQRDDEETILGVVRHIRGAYNISPDRIFLGGWSAGNYAVLWTGLRHPEIFRGLAVIQGNFDSAYLAGVEVDPNQPVLVLSGSTDVLVADQLKENVKWLNAQHARITEKEVPGFHGGHPETAYQFFEQTVRTNPWMHIRTFTVPGADPHTVKFMTRGSFEPIAFAWDFGDGGRSPVAEPTHTYAKPGTYTVSLTATRPDGKKITRRVELKVPQAASAP